MRVHVCSYMYMCICVYMYVNAGVTEVQVSIFCSQDTVCVCVHMCAHICEHTCVTDLQV